MDGSALETLAALCGIEDEYWDISGRLHRPSHQTRVRLLRAMGQDVRDEESARRVVSAWEDRRWSRGLRPVQVVRQGRLPLELDLRWPARFLDRAIEWSVMEEDGARHEGGLAPEEIVPGARRETGGREFVQLRLRLALQPGLGYHRLVLKPAGQDASWAEALLIVVPDTCHIPAGMGGDDRIWGLMAQLPAVRSSRNWGVGDFTDLGRLVELGAEMGAGLIGLSPLHALFPHDPSRISPYSPSSRRLLNWIYIDVEAVPDFAECEEARRRVSQPRFQDLLAALRDSELVDPAESIQAKRSVLELLYEHFRAGHLDQGSHRAQEFREFQRRGGHPFWLHGVHDTLAEHFQEQGISGWPDWPQEYRDPQGQAVADFAQEHASRIEFHQYLQWVADSQLAAVGRRSMNLGLKAGLYQDLAVGVDAAGLETWLHQDLYALEARLGAPPDDFHPQGQEWGLPPMIPHRLVEAGYGPFIQALRANMRNAGVLRIDHVMGLMRLFWIPRGSGPAEGAYVRYPMDDLIGIIALESRRNHCMVVGEDLGTVSDEVRRAMEEAQMHSYRLFYFEKEEGAGYRSPESYPDQALVTVGTHDLPTLPGYWSGRDIQVDRELGRIGDPREEQERIVERTEDRTKILMALSEAGLLPEGMGLEAAFLPEIPNDLIVAVYAYLARTPARLMTVQLEDVLGQVEQVNLPGDVHGRPNWLRKLPAALEELPQHPCLEGLAAVLRQERGVGRVALQRAAGKGKPIPCIPRATYRLQMHRDFTFDAAAGLVEYLRRLGVSHCYLSPILMARPGSLHGYDIIDHSRLNPEIGTRESFDRFSDELADRGMGLVLDMVPNHMGIGSDNPWWFDILENGPASPYAGFFDIDWNPVTTDLWGKVLLPVLEDHYGSVLERGLLRLEYDAEEGSFSAAYHEHRFPIDPRTYPILLTQGIDRLRQELGPEDPVLYELLTLSDALGNLPEREDDSEVRIEARRRDQRVLKRQLARLCAEHPAIARFVRENVEHYNGVEGDPESFDSLDRLLGRQAYRLSYWRVASDEINYRRFFEINELAALRAENPEVFEKTHGLILDLVRERRVHGLRIDHPDGLLDPREYCRRLQEAWAGTQDCPDRENTGAQGGRYGDSVRSLYVVLEKILLGEEHLPEDWPVHGTTGYDFQRDAMGLFVDGGAEKEFTRIYARFAGAGDDFEELVHRCKKLIIHSSMAGELNMLATALARIAEDDRHTRDFTLSRLRESLGEVVACFPVYRTYVSPEGVSEDDRKRVEEAIAEARERSRATDLSIYDFIARVLLKEMPEDAPEEARRAADHFALRFQQYTGPVMAKGMEDTAFYIYNRLLVLNEVGGDPTRFGLSVEGFHQANHTRLNSWPHTMAAGSTHDSKRSLDVRARLAVLTEIPERWQQEVSGWARANRAHKRRRGNRTLPSKNDEYAVYQTLAGSWPDPAPAGEEQEAYLARVTAASIKAVREAKVHSSWINIDPEYEESLVAFLRAALSEDKGRRFLSGFLPFQERLAHFGRLNSLAYLLVQLTAPGVPDLYQGEEVWNLRLVDPDNRAPVDFDARRALLQEMDQAMEDPDTDLGLLAREYFDTAGDARVKMYLIRRILHLRSEFPGLFRDGGYIPLPARGEKAGHVCAFARMSEGTTAITAAPRLCARLVGFGNPVLPVGAEVWGDTWIELPGGDGGPYRHVLTAEEIPVELIDGRPGIRLARIFRSVPLGLLLRAEDVVS